jgi:hypothetical protein
MKQGVSPNGLNTIASSSLLLEACSSNMEDVALTLLKHGAEVNFRDPSGFSPLSCSVTNNNLSLTKRLYEYGAHINYQSNLRTPLRIACENGCLPIVDFLYTRGGKGFNTFADLVVAAEEHIEVVSYLLQRIDPNSLARIYINLTYQFDAKIARLIDLSYMVSISYCLEIGMNYLNTLDLPLWHHLLPHKQEWKEHVEEAKRTETACYLALYEEADTMRRFRAGEMVEFSPSRLRGIMRPYGTRSIRNRVVTLLGAPKCIRSNYSLSLSLRLSETTCTESTTSA